MKKTLNIIERLFQVLLVIVILINLIAIVSVKLLKNSYPKIFGYSYFSVISGSMDPTINVGDEIIIKLTNDIKENDIVTYIQDGNFVTHRIIELGNDKVITKGDNNDSKDDPIDRDKIIGKFIFRIPYFGKIKLMITNTYFIIVLFIIYILYEFIITKEKEKNKENELKIKFLEEKIKKLEKENKNKEDDEIEFI